MRGRRLVRVHLKGGEPSITGYQRRGQWGGHLVLDIPKLHESAMATVSLEGVVEIPRENVAFLQVLMAVDGVAT